MVGFVCSCCVIHRRLISFSDGVSALLRAGYGELVLCICSLAGEKPMLKPDPSHRRPSLTPTDGCCQMNESPWILTDLYRIHGTVEDYVRTNACDTRLTSSLTPRAWMTWRRREEGWIKNLTPRPLQNSGSIFLAVIKQDWGRCWLQRRLMRQRQQNRNQDAGVTVKMSMIKVCKMFRSKVTSTTVSTVRYLAQLLTKRGSFDLQYYSE